MFAMDVALKGRVFSKVWDQLPQGIAVETTAGKVFIAGTLPSFK